MSTHLATLEYALLCRPRAGERRCGDAAWVQESPEGAMLAVVDGLGCGNATAEAAERAVAVLRAHAGESLLSLAHRCHEALLGTRGAGLCLAALNAADGVLSWIGIGEVEALLIPARPGPSSPPQHLLNFAGVAGDHLSPLQIQVAAVHPGDCLVFATRGLAPGFAAEAQVAPSVDTLAQALLDRFGDATEDALVLVVRWWGAGGQVRASGACH